MCAIQFNPDSNGAKYTKIGTQIDSNGKTELYGYTLNSVENSTIFDKYSSGNGIALPSSLYEGLATTPDTINGTFLSEVKNNDGTYTQTYRGFDGNNVTITGKKSGILGVFGIGSISNSEYTVAETDKNGNAVYTTQHNGYGTQTVLYDNDGNPDFSIWVEGDNDELSNFLSTGKINNDQTVSFTDYNKNGASFEERRQGGNNTVTGFQSSSIQQIYKDSNGNCITREEYLELNK